MSLVLKGHSAVTIWNSGPGQVTQEWGYHHEVTDPHLLRALA